MAWPGERECGQHVPTIGHTSHHQAGATGTGWLAVWLAECPAKLLLPPLLLLLVPPPPIQACARGTDAATVPNPGDRIAQILIECPSESAAASAKATMTHECTCASLRPLSAVGATHTFPYKTWRDTPSSPSPLSPPSSSSTLLKTIIIVPFPFPFLPLPCSDPLWHHYVRLPLPSK